MIQINEIWKKQSVMETTKNLISVSLLKKTYYNARINEIENKIPSISGFSTTATIAAV